MRLCLFPGRVLVASGSQTPAKVYPSHAHTPTLQQKGESGIKRVRNQITSFAQISSSESLGADTYNFIMAMFPTPKQALFIMQPFLLLTPPLCDVQGDRVMFA